MLRSGVTLSLNRDTHTDALSNDAEGDVRSMTTGADATSAGLPPAQGLYDPAHEHDACGVGFVVDIKGRRSHAIVSQALEVLKNLLHRGACGCEVNTGDGAGILIQMPHAFLTRECGRLGIPLPSPGHYGMGLVFLPRDLAQAAECEHIVESMVREEGQTVLGWRDVPTDSSAVGPSARAVEPRFRQIFVGRAEGVADRAAFERKLFVIRKRTEHAVGRSGLAERKFFYIPSLSANTLIYKGMLSADQIEGMFPDVMDPLVDSALALVHQRFSTNTFPSWPLAHPYRMIAHNGEINTLRGNINWMHAREAICRSSVLGDDLKKVMPVVLEGGSDSAVFDNVLEFLVMAGRPLPLAVLMMIPEAWAGHEGMSEERKAFYEYHGCLMEPWDGPASIAFTDGTVIGAVLDRNGLRPSRYYVTKDDMVIMASEVGVLDIPAERVLIKERLHPGRIFLVDTAQGRIIDDAELKKAYASQHPYGEWLKTHIRPIETLPLPPYVPEPNHETVLQRQQAFGYTHEDLRLLLGPMASAGEEPVGSMGTDTSLAVLSNRPRLLYDYFKQLFAQVTNPPLDGIREELVTQIATTIGPEGNLLEPTPEAARQLKLKTPILNNEEVARIRHADIPGYRSATIQMVYPVAEGGTGLARALEAVCAQASQAVRDGHSYLILSDRGVNEKLAPIPSLLATAGVHHHLIREGSRVKVGLVIESGDAREVHHAALLLGYGAGAINPYLAFETLDDMIRQDLLPGLDQATAVKHYIKALNKGVLKVISKMGISTIQSYRGAQIFEAIGLDKAFVDRYFTWTASRIGGVGIDVIAEETAARHAKAFPDRPVGNAELEWGGEYQWRREGEFHLFNPDTVFKLQHATRSGQYRVFKDYYARGGRADPQPRHAERALHPQAGGAGHPHRGRGAGGGDPHPLRHRRDVLRVHQPRGARDARHRHESHGRQVQYRRGRRGFRPVHARRQRRLAAERDQAGGVRTLRRHQRVPGQCRRSPDQDGPGGQARRGWPAPRPQGVSVDRQGPLLDAGGGAHLAAAAPRYLLHRGPGAAHPRPQKRQSEGAHQREAGGGGGRGHGGGRGGQGALRRGPHLGP